MWTLLAVWAFSTSRRLFQIGILLAGVGAGFVGIAGLGLLGVFRPAPPPANVPAPARAYSSFVGPALVVAGVLMAAGLVLLVLSVHYGTTPFSPRTK